MLIKTVYDQSADAGIQVSYEPDLVVLQKVANWFEGNLSISSIQINICSIIFDCHLDLLAKLMDYFIILISKIRIFDSVFFFSFNFN
ncbi:uncharacterized protein CELE_C02E7.8 [Caenorhabditis elegans]|uniref:Uncharacterized protein n=1 Tax=Caenorhabditis elegans TaxID=6239 RepID=O16429_CAEEL|nr:Uncharacterized protein CELE_C02E7.8 [Caenorhabditis elegans]CCD62589.1 Uncharacterized protein CELE_C02E7.8 [Caenorhabditis elegans]|eukprot:NP_504321.1 Uncharacterized protein CELE_C02E7.8 [Caenorhabditis elegans]